MLSRRVALLMAVAGMVVLMLALASVAWAAPGPPTVVKTVPADEATGVSTTANIKVRFSEAMKKSTINDATVHLYGPCIACTEIPATIKYDADSRFLIVNPTDPLEPNTEHTLWLEGKINSNGTRSDGPVIRDRSGTPLANDFFLDFTTGSGPPTCTIC